MCLCEIPGVANTIIGGVGVMVRFVENLIHTGGRCKINIEFSQSGARDSFLLGIYVDMVCAGNTELKNPFSSDHH